MTQVAPVGAAEDLSRWLMVGSMITIQGLYHVEI